MNYQKHIPPHVYLDNNIYFITANTLGHRPLFHTDEKLHMLSGRINVSCREVNADLIAWVALPNHYHLLLKVKSGDSLPIIIHGIHGGSSYVLNTMDNVRGREIWWNYREYCPKNEKDLWTHFNYIHHNPVKHGYVRNIQELDKYRFSSYRRYLDTWGYESLMLKFEEYPIVGYSVYDPE